MRQSCSNVLLPIQKYSVASLLSEDEDSQSSMFLVCWQREIQPRPYFQAMLGLSRKTSRLACSMRGSLLAMNASSHSLLSPPA